MAEELVKYPFVSYLGSVSFMTYPQSEEGPRSSFYKATTLVLLVALVIAVLISYVEIESSQNRIGTLEQTGLSVVSGQVTSSNDNLANVPYPSVIAFDTDTYYKVNSTIIQQHYITYLIDGLGYGVSIRFSNNTLCYVGTFAPKDSVATHNFSC
jgi:hypothetical protein